MKFIHASLHLCKDGNISEQNHTVQKTPVHERSKFPLIQNLFCESCLSTKPQKLSSVFFPTCKQHTLSGSRKPLLQITGMNSHITVDVLYIQADLSVKSAYGGEPALTPRPEKELGLTIPSLASTILPDQMILPLATYMY